MAELGRVVIGLGLSILVIGALLIVAGRLGLPLGRLPGDLHWRGSHWAVFAPLGTSLLLSVVLTLVLTVINYLRR